MDIEFRQREKISKEIHSVVKKSLEIGGSIKAMAPKVVLSLAGKLGGFFEEISQVSTKQEIYFYARLKHDGINSNEQ